MIKKLIFCLILCVLSNNATCQEIPVHHLKPPRLERENFGRRILCHRPMRYGSPMMKIEDLFGKTIIHNYGHGGSGWTLAPGCVSYMVHQWEQRGKEALDTPIAVIGAGVMGLLSAYELVKKGYTNVTLISDEFDDLVSHHAGGFLAPSTLQVEDEMQPLMDAICFDAYRFYENIALGRNNDFPLTAAAIMPIYVKRHEERLKFYEDHVMKKPYDVVIDFGNSKKYEMKVYEDGIFMNTDLLMESLRQFLKDKIKWVRQKINTFDDVIAPCIFNCTGLGAHTLNQDDAMISVQGHLILLENQNPCEMTYMISFGVEPGMSDHGQWAKRAIYMFPKHVIGSPETSIGIMGGTFIEGADATTPNEGEYELMMERARAFFGI